MGKHLIVTDGTTLLGADDKAGIAEIMAAAEFLMTARCNHATLKIGFTPDEEIGRGADLFDVKGFGADYAYTADGGPVGEIEYENFNAAGAVVEFKGLNIHPGSAKDKMVNSQYIAMEFQRLLPAAQKPEYTDGYEGLPCPNLCTGGENYHGRFEFIPVEDMEKCVKMLVKILTNF